MSTNTRLMRCSPEDVFAVLADGWLFPTWVVGASRMRDVDQDWPQAGSSLQHSFGVWPALINDETTVLEWDPPRRMTMQPKGWPAGEARVVIEVKPRSGGSVVRLSERAVRGPGSLVPAPLLDIPLRARNHETLRRLAFIAEGRRKNGEPSD
ncbi:SRPBCC family protein [Parafrigoribacterium soli]|uniref:SRPBCC family protein n=1 Tax=Parafrigoribacterium soli TaxID=3144663 RepID=UPI0032EC4054